MTPVDLAISSIRSALSGYVFRVRSEAELQDQVVDVLRRALGSDVGVSEVHVDTEVRKDGGRFDVVVQFLPRGQGVQTVVLELKLKASVSAVERQAQRYALMPDVDAVVVVTTSSRLAGQLTGDSLGGKPFAVIALRTT